MYKGIFSPLLIHATINSPPTVGWIVYCTTTTRSSSNTTTTTYYTSRSTTKHTQLYFGVGCYLQAREFIFIFFYGGSILQVLDLSKNVEMI